MVRRRALLALALLVLASGVPVKAFAQAGGEYTIGPGDILGVSVWRHPELERQVTVRTNGLATFPPIGDLKASGTTPTELSRQLMQRLRDYMGETTQVTVTVQAYNSRAVFLTGQITMPGRYSFEIMPDLLQLLSQAGGPLPSADLSSVRIVRPTPSVPKVIAVDLAAYMRGERGSLPALEVGDTVDVPSLVFGAGMTGPGLVYVLGEVKTPGAFAATQGMDVFQAIALAGGNTPEADLDRVAVVMNSGEGQAVAMLDLKRLAKNGTAHPFYLAPGDRVFVPRSGTGVAGQIWAGTSTVLTAARDILSSYLLYLTIGREIDDREIRDLQREALEEAQQP